MAFIEMVIRPDPDDPETLYYAFGGSSWFILFVIELVCSIYSEECIQRIYLDGL